MSTSTIQSLRGERTTLELVRIALFYLAIAATVLMSVTVVRPLFEFLVVGWTQTGAGLLGVHRLHVMAIAGVVATVVLAIVASGYRPARAVALYWGAVVGVGVALWASLTAPASRPEEVFPFLVVLGVMGLTHPAGRGLFRRGSSFSPLLLGLVALAAVPALAFAGNQTLSHLAMSDAHALDGHYGMMVAASLTALTFGLLAALGFEGWRRAALHSGLLAVYLGALSLAMPAQTSAVGSLWAGLAVVWGVTFVLVSELSIRIDSRRFRRVRSSPATGPEQPAD